MIEKDEAVPSPINKTVKKVKLELDELEKLAGNYAVFGQIMTVVSKKHKLKGKIGGIGLDLIPVEGSRFKVTHWTHEIGLTKIIPPPVDLDRLSIEFINNGKNADSNLMIINLDNISYEICPKYPLSDHIGLVSPGNIKYIKGYQGIGSGNYGMGNSASKQIMT